MKFILNKMGENNAMEANEIHNKKGKVLQICGIQYGGIESLILNLITTLNNKFQFEYFSPIPKGDSYLDRIKTMNIPIHFVKNNKLTQIIQLFRILKNGKFDVVHSHSLFFSGLNLFIAFLAGVPIRIAHAHSTNNKNKLTLIRRIYENSMRFFINIFSTDMIAVSKEAAIYVFGKKSINSPKLKIIPNGINYEIFNPENYNPKIIKKELGLKEGDVHFVTVARFSFSKNHSFLINVFEEILNFIPNAHLTLVGSGDLERDIKIFVKEKNLNENVTFLGARNDVASIMSAMDYFILPSLWEGFGIVFIEAQAMGLHCFASDKVPRETDAGKIDYIPLDKTPFEWAKYIYNKHIQLKNNKRKMNFRKKFDIKTVGKNLVDIYERNNIEKKG